MRRLCIVMIIGFLLLMLASCGETQQTKVWGKGDLPADWKGFFGDDNFARLNYVQTQTINRQGQIISVLAERVSALEADPNEAVLRRND